MDWNEMFDAATMPSDEDIRRFLECAEPLWGELTSWLEDSYRVRPQMAYSKCPGAPGWNVKYRKGGKSLCTLYPMAGFFIALVVVGAKEESAVEAVSESLTPYVRDMYRGTPAASFGRWLMIRVTNRLVLDDVRDLIAIRVKPSDGTRT